jgi:DNA-binding NarL/FixJ family response regulator
MSEPPGDDTEASIRVVIADDDPLVRRVLRDALDRADFQVVAEARDGNEAVERTLALRPDVVLMDVVMPGLDGISAIRQIVEVIPDQLVVVLTSGDDEDVGVVALRAGASGFLAKELDVDVLPGTLKKVLSGEAAIPRRLSLRLVEEIRGASDRVGLRPVRSPLTPREWEVADLLTQGHSTAEMAEQLVLSTETVRSHMKNIMRKLEVRSRADAVLAVRRMRDQPPGG